MAAYAALVSLMNNIEQMMSHPHLSASLHNNLIQTLLEKAGLLLGFIEDYNYGGVVNKEAEDLERRIARAAHAAEDAIESHIVDQIHAESASSSLFLRVRKEVSHMKKKVKHLKRRIRSDVIECNIVDQIHAGSIEVCRSCSPHLHQIIEEIEAVLEKARTLKEKAVELQLQLREEQPSNSRVPAMETAMVGCEDELIQIMDKLTNQQSSLHVISIDGMGGIGKSTLARTIYDSLLINRYFDIRAWATVSQQHSATEILSQLLGNFSDKNVYELGEQLHKTLYGRRYLIILDDIWDVEVWDELSRFFPENGNGSRIVLTTRFSNVANHCGDSCFKKKHLDRNKSWKLFCEKAFGGEDGCPNELEEVGKEIVELCRGLPLSIVVIGRSLYKSPITIRHWKHVAQDIRSIPNSKEKQESLDVLFSSYHHLPPCLKPCFLYIGIFKSVFSKIRVSEIIKLWVAEGFLKSNGGEVLEEIAEDYLKDLIDRNLILVGSRSDSGKMKCCDVHDLLRDLCLKVAEQQEFFHVTEGLTRGIERHLIFTGSMMKGSVETPLARSITANYVSEQELHKHRLLRILDVRQFGSVKRSLGRVNLRYLALDHPISWRFQRVWKVPTSVSLVWNLQTLIIHHYWWPKMVVVAPIEIWKMRRLRHIECHKIYLPHPPLNKGRDDLFLCENLQSLKLTMNLRLSEEVCNIIPNIKKLHLVYHDKLQGYDDSLIECLCNPSLLHKLESLKLMARSKWLTQNPKLNKILTFSTSLKKLALYDCGLHWNDLTIIGSLPQLEVLKFSVAGEQWSPIDGQFLRLKFLEISFCDLACWNAESCHFPVLEKLFLENLRKLEEIPWGIGEILTLELIRLSVCNNSVAISAVDIKDELESQGNSDLKIQVFEYMGNVGSFEEMMEEKLGRTVNNFKIQVKEYAFHFPDSNLIGSTKFS